MTWVADIPRRFVREPTAAEYRELRRLRGTQLPGLAVRARIVLLSAERVPIPEIMRRRRVSRPTVAGWLRRFEQSGVPGLLTRARSGRPSRVTPDLLRHLAIVTSARPRDLGVPRPAWSLAQLREYLVKTGAAPAISLEDRKSTRLNSSHTVISYAVFCLKKKKKKNKTQCKHHAYYMTHAA